MATINLRAAELDLKGTVGDDLSLEITVTDSGGSAVDLSGYTIQADVYRNDTSVATFTDAVSGASSNVLTLSLTDTQTTTIGNERKLRAYIALDAPTAGQTVRVVKLLCRVAVRLIRDNYA